MKLLAPLILASLLLAGCTSNEGGGDRDGDGMEDWQERQGWTIRVVTMESASTYAVDSDPTSQDTDGDGVWDLFEFALSLDPRQRDTDGDGLTDCQEVRHTVAAECEDPNWDGESDGGYGTAAHLADSDSAPSRYVNDRRSDFLYREMDAAGTIMRGDGLSDGAEVAGFTIDLPLGQRHVVLDPLKVDTDHDFLEDAEEILLFGTDPTVADSDGDGCEDGFDPLPSFEERYDVGLGALVWDEEGRSGTTYISFIGSVADRPIFIPEAATMQIEHGKPVDLGPLAPPPRAAAACSYQPSDPWIRIDFQVAEFDGSGRYLGPLDVVSGTIPEGVSLWWNVQTSHFDFQHPAVAPFTLDGPMRIEGRDGHLTVAPRVLGAPDAAA